MSRNGAERVDTVTVLDGPLRWMPLIGNNVQYITISPSWPMVCGMLGHAPSYGWTTQRLQDSHIHTNTKRTCTDSMCLYVNRPYHSLWSLYSPVERIQSQEATNARCGMSTFILVLPQYSRYYCPKPNHRTHRSTLTF